MNYKTKLRLGISLIFLILIMFVWWWISLQSKDSFLHSMDCGKSLKLKSYELYNETQVTETIAELQDNTGSSNYHHQSLSNEIDCFIPRNLPSQGYFLTKSNAHNYLVQATHAHDDLYTGEIVKLLMQNPSAAKYASISSVQRHVLDSSVQESLSNSVAANLISQGELAAVIQIHGFSQEKRKSRAAKAANIIISSGDKDSNLLANSIYQCLDNNFEQVYLFGKNIYELGATENRLVLRLQEKGFDQHFIHIELSLTQRKSLLNNTELLKFGRCFLQGDLNALLS